MAIVSSVDIGGGMVYVVVDHDPNVVATDVPKGSRVEEESTGIICIKSDDGPTTNVKKIISHAGEIFAGVNETTLANVVDLKVNLVAVIDPAASNDNTEGYSVGSRWFNITLDKEFVCIDAATAAAIWKGTTPVSITFSRGGSILTPAGAVNIMVWRANAACTVTALKGYRVGGTGATINAGKGTVATPTDLVLASDLSIASDEIWTDGGAVQNTSFAVGDPLIVVVASVAGSPFQIAIQVDFTKG